MNTSHAPLVTRRDVARLEQSVLDSSRRRGAADMALRALEERLEAAIVVASAEIAADVVTMNSRVTLADVAGGRRQTVTLSYPQDADAERARVSVLAPLGRALLGARVDETVTVELPGAAPRELRVVAIEYQPEAAGDFEL